MIHHHHITSSSIPFKSFILLPHIYHYYSYQYSKLFDPRVIIAKSVGPTAQAEHVTGTHLYAFLMEASG